MGQYRLNAFAIRTKILWLALKFYFLAFLMCKILQKRTHEIIVTTMFRHISAAVVGYTILLLVQDFLYSWFDFVPEI